MLFGKKFKSIKTLIILFLFVGILVSCTPTELNDYLNNLTGLDEPESFTASIEKTVLVQQTQNSVIATKVALELQTKATEVDHLSDEKATATQQPETQQANLATDEKTDQSQTNQAVEPTNTLTASSTPKSTSLAGETKTSTVTTTPSKTITKTPTSEKTVLNPTKTKTKTKTKTTIPTLAPSKTKVATKTPTKTTQPTTKPTNTMIPPAAATSTPRPQNTATFTPILPSPTTPPSGCAWTSNSGFESSLISLINSERSNRGLSTLSQYSALTTAARNHSQDMACNNFFSHTGSNGSSPFSRMIAAGYSYSTASENIYAGSGGYNSASSAFSSWMNSDGHRNNMLNPDVTHIGIGYAYFANSDYGGYVTANFGAP